MFITRLRARHLLVIYGIAALVGAWLVFPTFWMLLTSLKSPAAASAYPPSFIFQPTGDNFSAVLADENFGLSLFQTLTVSIAAAILGVVVGALAAYSMARFCTGGAWLFFALIFVQSLPAVVLGLPFYMMFRQLGLYDTMQGLILSYATFSLPYATWLMIPFFEDIPLELEDAARVDGCSRWGAFRRVVLPLSMPGLVVVGILTFMMSWNQFFFALVLAGDQVRMLPLLGSNFISTFTVEWGRVAAYGMLLLVPPLAVVFALQGRIVRGLTFGAVKG